MGTQRDASLNLSDLDGKEIKKQNMENGTVPIEGSTTNQGGKATAIPPENGGHKLGNSEKEGKTVSDAEIIRIRDDVCKLKSFAKSQRDEIRDGIMAITNKLGEMFIAHSATATSANFYGDFMEQLSS